MNGDPPAVDPDPVALSLFAERHFKGIDMGYSNVHGCPNAYIYRHICMYVYICMYAYICIYIYIYI